MTSWFYTVIFIFLRMQTILPFIFSIHPRSSCCRQIAWKKSLVQEYTMHMYVAHVYSYIHIILQLIRANWKECTSSPKSLQWIVSDDNKDKVFFSLVSTIVSYAKCVVITDHSFYVSVTCCCFYLYLCYKNDNIKSYTHISICKVTHASCI